MIRIFDGCAKQLLMVLAVFRGKFGRDISSQEIAGMFRQRSDKGLELGQDDSTKQLNSTVEYLSNSPDEPSLDDLINQICEQVRGAAFNGTDTDVDFIDTIVQILQLQFGKNTISGKGMERLRKAILLPAELAALKLHLRDQVLSCAACGVELRGNSLVVLHKDNDAGPELMCLECSFAKHGSNITCRVCHENGVQLTKKGIGFLLSLMCGGCKNREKKVPEPGPVPFEPLNLEPPPQNLRGFTALEVEMRAREELHARAYRDYRAGTGTPAAGQHVGIDPRPLGTGLGDDWHYGGIPRENHPRVREMEHYYELIEEELPNDPRRP